MEVSRLFLLCDILFGKDMNCLENKHNIGLLYSHSQKVATLL